jgi:hypothetical protein
MYVLTDRNYAGSVQAPGPRRNPAKLIAHYSKAPETNVYFENLTEI